MVVEYFDIEDGKLAVDVTGDGPLILCSPAMGDLRDAYAPLASRLVTQGFTVACMDPRGHGDSSTTFKRYGDEATASDYISLIEKLNKGPAILAGASFSAGAATIAAGRRPDLIKGLILLGPFLRNGPAIGAYLVKILTTRPWGPTLWKAFSKSLWPGLGSEGAAARAEHTSKALEGSDRWTAFQQTVKGADHSVVEPYLSKVNDVPALVVMGEKDPDFSKPAEEAQWIASNFAKSKVLLLPEVGHAPHLERAEDVCKAVLEFIGTLN